MQRFQPSASGDWVARRISTTVAISVIIGAGRCVEAIVQINSEDRAAIEAILQRQAVAWAAGDAVAFAADALDGVVFTNIVGMFSVGRAPFVGQHAQIFSTIYKGSRLSQEVVAVTPVRPDVAIVDTLTRLVDALHRPPGIELIDGAVHTRLEQVMVKDGGAWKVASFHNVAVHPSVANADGAARDGTSMTNKRRR
jgi:uncharacterized protein (TIGR02246 family)